MCHRVDKRRVGQGQVDAKQDIEDALVCWRTPRIDEKVVVGVQAPARSAKEAQQEVDDEAHNCMHGEVLAMRRGVVCAMHHVLKCKTRHPHNLGTTCQ